MLAGKNAAQACLGCGRGESHKRTLHARQDFRSHIEGEVIALEERPQHKSAGKAHDAMSAWIGWIGRGVHGQWEPVWVGCCFRITIGVGGPNGGDRTPKTKSIFGIVERYY